MREWVSTAPAKGEDGGLRCGLWQGMSQPWQSGTPGTNAVASGSRGEPRWGAAHARARGETGVGCGPGM